MFQRRILTVGLMSTLGLGWGGHSPVLAAPDPSVVSPMPLAQASPQTSLQTAPLQGNTLALNGLRVTLPWMQREGRIWIADYGLTDYLGVSLINSTEAQRQPVRWFTDGSAPLILGAEVRQGHRYLDLTPIQSAHGWSGSIQGQTLTLAAPTTQITALRSSPQSWGQRWVIDVSGPTLTHVGESADAVSLTLAATSTEAVARSVMGLANGSGAPRPQVTTTGQTTRITLPITQANARPVLSTLTNPHRIVVDVRTDHLRPLDILWAAGLRWRQRYVTVAEKSFPVYWLQLSANPSQVTLRPIWTDPTTATGITPLQTMAQRWQAAAAINAGFFNRNNQYPLGAVRYNHDWISGPILGRGAVGWNDQGQVQMERLVLRQTLTTSHGPTFSLQAINSGYVQAGIGLYTPTWGSSYRPITGSETIVTVRRQQVVGQQRGTGEMTFPIPPDGYLLALRSYETAAPALEPGTAVTLQSDLVPASLSPLPHIVGGGPLLLRNSRMVSDPALEQFSTAFARQAAPRSAIGHTAQGDLLLVAVHTSPAGPGPTLTEMAQIMAQLGSVNALNLDGGSSASLYLGGRLINRHPRTAARVNNGIGVFVP